HVGSKFYGIHFLTAVWGDGQFSLTYSGFIAEAQPAVKAGIATGPTWTWVAADPPFSPGDRFIARKNWPGTYLLRFSGFEILRERSATLLAAGITTPAIPSIYEERAVLVPGWVPFLLFAAPPIFFYVRSCRKQKLRRRRQG